MIYNYRDAEIYAKSLGLVWVDDWVKDFDAHAKDHGFTQAQVDLCLNHHLMQVTRVLNPKSYTIRKRIGLALHFLTGKKLAG